MIKKLSLGLGFDSDGDPYPIYESISKLIPENHDYLFDFLNKEKDIIKLQAELTNYLFPDSNEEEKVARPDKNFAAYIIEGIKQLHPYFQYGNAASRIFNQSIADQLWNVSEPGADMSEKFSEYVYLANPYQSKDINDYIIGDERHETLDTLYTLVWDLNRRIVLILDDSNPGMKKLTPEQRNSLYSYLSPCNPASGELDVLNVPVTFSLPVSSGMRSFGAAMDFDDNLMEKYLHTVDEMISSPGSDLPSVFQSAVAYSDGKNEDSVMTYEVHTLKDLFDFEIFSMISDGIRVLRCKKCGRLFPVVYKGQKYCTFTKTDGVSCYEQEFIHKERKGRDDLSAYLSRLRTKAYKVHYARVYRGVETKEQMKEWQIYAGELKEKAMRGEISKEYFKKYITDPENQTRNKQN